MKTEVLKTDNWERGSNYGGVCCIYNGDEIITNIQSDTADLIIAAVNACKEINKDNPLNVAKALPDIIKALQYYKDGIDHFYKCINFKKSFLDAKAIIFMNESGVRISKALKQATE